MDDYYFDGDPAVDSTRRHLERVLEGRQSRRWPWVVAALAGGAAFAFWRNHARRAQPPQTAADAAPMPTRDIHHAR
jgi:hypothetical protein